MQRKRILIDSPMSVKQAAQVIYMRIVNAAMERFEDHDRPKEGWLATMRKALGMSGPQMAKRAGVSKAAIYQAERKELAGEVTIKQMEKMASALGGKFVYAVVPDLNTIPMRERNRQAQSGARAPAEALMLAHARAKAEAIVGRADTHMSLEQQGLGVAQNELEIERLTSKLMVDLPSDFWDEP